MVLVSFSKYGLDQMLIICHKYSLKWRYEYNASKCSVIVFNELQSAYKKSKRQWELHSDQTINESENYTHLGNKCMCLADSVREASTKLRGTFLSLVNSGLHPNGLNSCTFLKIYKSIMLPKALYVCELWSCLSLSNITQLERSHRFCLKFIQNVPLFTNNDIGLGCL